jgi:type VI secretion system protein ImpA
MSEALSTPSVVDLDALLAPIEGENPSGPYLRYSGIYDEISEARRADDVVVKDDYETGGKTADYRQVISLANSALGSESKDMQIAAWFSEALVRIYGFDGLRDACRLMAGLQETFWDTIHPQIEEGDMEGRANAISWMDEQCAMAIKRAPITNYQGFSFLDYEDSKRFDFPDNIETLDEAEQIKFNELKSVAELQGRVTAQRWAQDVTNTRRAFYEGLSVQLEECWSAYKHLNEVLDAQFDRNQVPSMLKLRKSLEEVEVQVKRLHEQKKLEEPDESDAVDGDGTSSEAGGGGSAGPVKSRQDALRKLSEVAEYFRRTEPHSPVSYLVQRAVKWGNMPLETWLQDVIKDDATLYSLRQTLGLGTSESDNDY